MKHYFFTCFALLFWSIAPSLYAVWDLDHFEVILGKNEAKVWEALDITISAVDENDEILTDYTGDILVFSESDTEAEFPNDLAENSYSFLTADQWSVKFENAIKFNNPGLQDLYVYDLNDEDILGIAEVSISEDEVISSAEIAIVSPENGITLAKDAILVSGTTQKNHQVRIQINDVQDLFTTSNSDGIFEKEVEWLDQWANEIQAFILDADNEVIWESEVVILKINSNAPVFKSLKIEPAGDIDSETEMTVQVIATIWLREVQVIINDVITSLEEWDDGIYSATTIAPKDPGQYGVDVILRDDFALETREREVETFNVIPSTPLNSWEVQEVIPVEPEPVEVAVVEETLNLGITDIKVVELKTRSVVTWAALPDAKSYNIYKKGNDGKIELIANVGEPKYEIAITGDVVKYEDFAIKAVGQTSAWKVVQWDLSEMTKVKTGPEMYIFMFLIAMLLTGWVYSMRRNQA